jgi:hypothetical protein
MRRLNLKKLEAMRRALHAALAGAGFDGGDFDGEDPKDYEAALDWVLEQIAKREGGEAQLRPLV